MAQRRKKKIILTGGAGFIGSCFLWKLNRENIDDVIVVDHLAGGSKWKNLAGKRFLDYVQKDDFLEALASGKFGSVQAIVHLGACSSTLLDDAGYFLKNNYEYSKRLALWAAGRGVRFIYASSAATYGDGSAGYEDAEDGLKDLRPLNIYGYTKHLFDLWMLKNGFLKKAAGLKFFNVFGPNEYHKADMMSVICRRFDDVRAGRPMQLFKSYRPDYMDGEQKRDFIYVKDAVEVIYYFLAGPAPKGGIYNLGTGRARTWNDVAKAMFSAVKRKPQIEYIDMPQALQAKYQYSTEADIRKLRAAGCRYVFTPLEDAIKDYTGYLEKGSYL